MPTKKSSSKKSSSKSRSSAGSKPKSSSRSKYGPKAQELVHTEMRHLKKGEHKNREQAIAIGLSKARRSGAKVPAPKGRKAA
jgi:Family of unknown function (DUF6496)